MSKLKRIEQLQANLDAAYEKLTQEIADADADGIRDSDERKKIDRLTARVERLRTRLLKTVDQLPSMEFTDDEVEPFIGNAPVDWSATSKVRLHFDNQYKGWISQVRAELNVTHSQYNDTETKITFGEDDVLALASLIPVIGSYIGMFTRIKTTTTKFLVAALPSGPIRFKTLHSNLDTGFLSYYQHGFEAEFNDFKTAFEKKHESYSEADVIAEINKLSATLPVKEIGQELVAKLMNNVADGYDFNDYAGVLEIEVKCLVPVMSNNYTFSEVSGYLDDANEALLNAVQHAFKSKRAMELPVPVIITVVDALNRNDVIFKVKRSSNDPTNNELRLIDTKGNPSSEWILEQFEQDKPYLRLKVAQLKVE